MEAYVHDLFSIDMTRAAARVDGLVKDSRWKISVS